MPTEIAHTDHPLRVYDRTCPACLAGGLSVVPTSDAVIEQVLAQRGSGFPHDSGTHSGSAHGLTALIIERDALVAQVATLQAELKAATCPMVYECSYPDCGCSYPDTPPCVAEFETEQAAKAHKEVDRSCR